MKRAAGSETKRVWNACSRASSAVKVNAVMHADYAQWDGPIRIAIFDDRIEIDSPGLLLPGLTLKHLWRGVSRLRNPVIARVFHELGIIETWGSGIRRMAAACEKAELPPPRLEEIGTFFRITLFTRRSLKPVLSDVDAPLVMWLRIAGGASTSQIAALLQISMRAARLRLESLVSAGVIAEVGSAPTDRRRRYVAVNSDPGANRQSRADA